MSLYFEFLPEEITELILFNLDNISSVNKLYTFPIFQRIYNGPYFIQNIIKYNLPYYVNFEILEKFGYNIHNKIHFYSTEVKPAYIKAIERFNLYTEKSDKKTCE